MDVLIVLQVIWNTLLQTVTTPHQGAIKHRFY